MKKIMFSILVGSLLLYSCKKAATEIAEETSEVIGKNGVRKLSVEVEEQVVKDITEEAGEISIKSVSKLIPNRPYSRIAIDKEFKIIKAKMHSEALQRGAKENVKHAVFKDAYTGKKLIGGGKYEFDHIRSSEKIFNKYKAILTDDEKLLFARYYPFAQFELKVYRYFIKEIETLNILLKLPKDQGIEFLMDFSEQDKEIYKYLRDRDHINKKTDAKYIKSIFEKLKFD